MHPSVPACISVAAWLYKMFNFVGYLLAARARGKETLSVNVQTFQGRTGPNAAVYLAFQIDLVCARSGR